MGKGDGNWPDFRTRRTSKARSPAGDTSRGPGILGVSKEGGMNRVLKAKKTDEKEERRAAIKERKMRNRTRRWRR